MTVSPHLLFSLPILFNFFEFLIDKLFDISPDLFGRLALHLAVIGNLNTFLLRISLHLGLTRCYGPDVNLSLIHYVAILNIGLKNYHPTNLISVLTFSYPLLSLSFQHLIYVPIFNISQELLLVSLTSSLSFEVQSQITYSYFRSG